MLLPNVLLHMVSGSCMLHPGRLQAVVMPKVLLLSGQCYFSVQDVLMQVRTQLAQRAMSAHDMGVGMASHERLSTLESGSNSQSCHAASEPPLDFATCFRVTIATACTVCCASAIPAKLCCSIKRTRCISTHDAQKQRASLHVGPFFRRSLDVTAGQEYTRAQPYHVDSAVLLEYDPVCSATLCYTVSTKKVPLQSSECIK